MFLPKGFVMALLWKCFVILTISLGASAKNTKSSKEVVFKKEKIQLDAKVLTVEIAETNAQHERGLMYRTKLGSDEGMLFIFPSERPLQFWMKNTYIDLSIGYFDKNAILVDVQEMKATSMMEASPPTYPSAKSAKYALEMNKGWFAKNKVKIGAKIKFLESRQ